MSRGSSPEFQFDENQYERPNQPWVCGRNEEGRACPLGPSGRGACRATFECAPYRVRDHWVCTRSATSGGKCDTGPFPDGTCCRPLVPCRPVRSVLAKRWLVSLFACALSLGVALVMVGVPQRSNLISPGRLTSQHATIVDGCVACHALGQGKLRDWVHAAFAAEPAPRQSEQCLRCHSNLREHARNPHNQDLQALTAITRRIVAADKSDQRPLLLTAARLGQGEPTAGNQSLACARCHHEHSGQNFDLTAMSNLQCQTCHVDAFHSFSQGHPEFARYPYTRRSRLYFDHESHYGQHFHDYLRVQPGDNPTRACSDCHTPSADGKSMLVRDFETACAKCHLDQIEDDTAPGVAFMALPALDLETLRSRNANIGQWPEIYPAHVLADGQLPPLMQLLLRSDPEFAAAQAQLANLNLFDLSRANPEQLKAVESYVWSLKKLLYEIVTVGQVRLRQQVAQGLAPEVTEPMIVDLVGQIPLRLFLVAQQRWLPNLVSEIELRQNGNALTLNTAAPPADNTALESDMGAKVVSGWYLRDIDLSMRYRPTGHADTFLHAWLDVSARHTNGSLFGTTLSPVARLAPRSDFDNIFVGMANPSADGRCMKCHTVDSRPGEGLAINWHSKQPSQGEHNFTKFAHAPHLRRLEDAACLPCHALKKPADSQSQWSLFRSEFIGDNGSLSPDPHRFVSNFAPLSKTQCGSCHVPRAAGDNCLTCHNYHISGGHTEAAPVK